MTAHEGVNPEESLIETVGKSGLPALLDSAEAALDVAMNEGFLKELPVIGTAARLYGIGRHLREGIFFRKLVTFLREVSHVPEAERQKFARVLQDDKAEARKVGEAVLELLDRLNGIEKALLLGRFFCAFLQERIDRRTFDQLGWSLDRFFLQDVDGLRTLYDKNFPDSEVGARIVNAGLANTDVVVPFGGGVLTYHINSLGQKFIEMGGLA